MSEFQEFKKIARLSRDVFVTEKIDGTNAQVLITADPEAAPPEFLLATRFDGLRMFAGSRNRYITPDADNFGFAAWVKNNAEALFGLGAGRHFGEWWGSGIQRGYGLSEKRWSLFNVGRWHAVGEHPRTMPMADPRVTPKSSELCPPCCHVVPVLWKGRFDTHIIDSHIESLRNFGSFASPGYMKPEGVVIYHMAGDLYFKKTLEKDGVPKGWIK